MVRASTLGLINFAQFDPMDGWWWKKLYWTIDELATTQNREAITLQHRHWSAFLGSPKLSSEGFDTAKTNSSAALNRFLKNIYPWLADEIGETGTQGERQQAVAQFTEEFGKPGERRYEEMVSTLSKFFAKGGATVREKAAARKRFAERRAAARAAALAAAGHEVVT